ncbi:MAG: sortase [Lachnospiraceae bacterium]|nr:sortase [Lachnospiraceae bacterium]
MEETRNKKELKAINHKGIFMMLFGLLLILAAGALLVHNRLEDARAGRESALALSRVEAATSDTLLRGLSNLMPIVQIDGRDYIGRVQVESIGLDLPVIAAWDEEDALVAPCRFSGSAYDDSLVICGHNMRAHFSPIKNLERGTQVTFTDVNGNVFTYELTDTLLLQPEQVEDMVTGDDWDLTLFTCNYGGNARVTLRCKRTSEDF